MKVDWNKPIIMRWREGKAGGGKGGMYSERSFTIATGNDQVLILDGTRVNDVRVYDDGIAPTVISRYGTGGGNVPAIAVDFYNASLGEMAQTIKSHSPNDVNIGGVMTETVVRRLTPLECERLQGFPDGWTEGQADSNRYKQMGNAVAVPVVEWIIGNMVEQLN
jgi:DNA (cytosine-5)-methyltransferase 1